jgi:hypothetical protein
VNDELKNTQQAEAEVAKAIEESKKQIATLEARKTEAAAKHAACRDQLAAWANEHEQARNKKITEGEAKLAELTEKYKGQPNTPVQKEGGGTGGDGVAAQAAASSAFSGSAGGSLPFYDRIQASFGHHDLSGVKAFRGAGVDTAASSIGTSAFTQGSNVALGSGSDLHTVAHEAAHVVQQKSGVNLSSGVGRAGDSYERPRRPRRSSARVAATPSGSTRSSPGIRSAASPKPNSARRRSGSRSPPSIRARSSLPTASRWASS